MNEDGVVGVGLDGLRGGADVGDDAERRSPAHELGADRGDRRRVLRDDEHTGHTRLRLCPWPHHRRQSLCPTMAATNRQTRQGSSADSKAALNRPGECGGPGRFQVAGGLFLTRWFPAA